jgi:hypothetical protein
LPANDTATKVVNAKYLLCAVDKVTESLNGKAAATKYCLRSLATTQAADAAAVHDAVDRLVVGRCAGGTWLDGDSCADCGMGHYCIGGGERAVCTYGAAACPGADNSADLPMPPGENVPVNKALTLDEVNRLIPPTDISSWRLVLYNSSGCQLVDGNCYWNDAVNGAGGCTGTLSPGTYLFAVRYREGNHTDWIDDLERVTWAYDYKMAVIDRSVGYKIARSCNLGNDIFLDEKHAEFQSWTSRPVHYFNCTKTSCSLPFNVSNLAAATADFGVYVFELK